MLSCLVHQQALYRRCLSGAELQCCLWETEGMASLLQSWQEAMWAPPAVLGLRAIQMTPKLGMFSCTVLLDAGY